MRCFMSSLVQTLPTNSDGRTALKKQQQQQQPLSSCHAFNFENVYPRIAKRSLKWNHVLSCRVVIAQM